MRKLSIPFLFTIAYLSGCGQFQKPDESIKTEGYAVTTRDTIYSDWNDLTSNEISLADEFGNYQEEDVRVLLAYADYRPSLVNLHLFTDDPYEVDSLVIRLKERTITLLPNTSVNELSDRFFAGTEAVFTVSLDLLNDLAKANYGELQVITSERAINKVLSRGGPSSAQHLISVYLEKIQKRHEEKKDYWRERI